MHDKMDEGELFQGIGTFCALMLAVAVIAGIVAGLLLAWAF